MEPQLVRMVRQALRGGTGSTTLDTRILAEVRRTTAEGRQDGPLESLTAPVAGRLCQAVLERLQRQAVARLGDGETVVES